MYNIRPATLDDVETIAANPRAADVAELWATSYSSPRKVMLQGVQEGEESYVAEVDGEVICMWGVVRPSLMFRDGIPWMVGAEGLDRHAFTFLRHCQKPVMQMLRRYGNLTNYVDARNSQTIAWLLWLGFKIEDPKPFGVLQLPFHRFTMRGDVDV